MATDRRAFLKALGYTSAIVPAVKGGAPELVKEPDAKPINELPFYHQVSNGYLFSGTEIPRNEMQPGYSLFYETMGNPMSAWPRTNMHQGGRLPMPSAFGIEQIQLIFAPNVTARLAAAFIARYAIQLDVCQKVYFHRPLAALPALKGLPDQIGPAPLCWNLALPIVIPPDHTFSVLLRGDPMRTHDKIRFWVALHGRHMRAIQ